MVENYEIWWWSIMGYNIIMMRHYGILNAMLNRWKVWFGIRQLQNSLQSDLKVRLSCSQHSIYIKNANYHIKKNNCYKGGGEDNAPLRTNVNKVKIFGRLGWNTSMFIRYLYHRWDLENNLCFIASHFLLAICSIQLLAANQMCYNIPEKGALCIAA